MSFDRGYSSPYFVTDQERQLCELENPKILITDQKISTLELRLQWDKSNSAEDQLQGQRTWNAKLSFDCGSAGQLISMISLRGKKCAALFWAPNADIKNKVSISLDDLNEVLTQQGMIVDKLQCVLGIPKNNSNNMSITKLLDTSI